MEVGRPLARQVQLGAGDAVVREHDVEDRGDLVAVDLAVGDAAADDARADRAGAVNVRRVRVEVEAGEEHLRGAELAGLGDGHDGFDAVLPQVPLAHPGVAVAVGHGAAGVGDAAVGLHGQQAVGGVGGVAQFGVGRRRVVEKRGGEELARGERAVLALVQRDEERGVGVLAHVVDEVRRLPAHVEFGEDHVAHGEGQGGVGARVDAQPLVGELRAVGEVRGDDDDLGAVVAGLHHEVGVRGTGDRDVGAPHHEVGGVVPVAGLRYVGLVAEGLRGSGREVGVPVVEGQGDAADHLQETGARAVGDLRHRGDDREAGDTVRPVLADGVGVGGGRDLDGLLVGDADEAALAALGDVGVALLRGLDDFAPGQDRVAEPRLGLAVHVHENAAGVGVADTRGGVGVPGERGAAGAAARLVVGHVRAGRGVVHGLGLPGDHAVLDVDLPGAGTRAVHAVRGADHLVEGPAVAVEDVRLAAALEEELLTALGHLALAEEATELEQRVGCGGCHQNILCSSGRWFSPGTGRWGGRSRSRRGWWRPRRTPRNPRRRSPGPSATAGRRR